MLPSTRCIADLLHMSLGFLCDYLKIREDGFHSKTRIVKII